MALAKKGTRRITVGGRVYRWVVAANDGYMNLVVELACDPGQKLGARFDYRDICRPECDGIRIIGQRTSITSGVVRAVIETALEKGWQPAARGLQPFSVDGDILHERFKSKEAAP